LELEAHKPESYVVGAANIRELLNQRERTRPLLRRIPRRHKPSNNPLNKAQAGHYEGDIGNTPVAAI
jgi:hypothetical protein